jgi:hypothetical protein
MIDFDWWVVIVTYELYANAHGFAIQILERWFEGGKTALDNTQYFLSNETPCQVQKAQSDMYYNPPTIQCYLMAYFDHQKSQQSFRCII